MTPNILSPEKIRELAQSATKGPWYNGRLGLIVTKGGKTVVSANIMSDVDSAFIAALPDIAATALHYADRVKELEKELEAKQRNRTRLFNWYNDDIEVEIWKKH